MAGDDTHTLTLTGDLADINAELAGVSYTATANGDSPVADTVGIQATDPHDAFAQQSLPVQIFPVPLTVPVLNAPPQELLVPGTPSALGGISVSDPYAAATSQQLSFESAASVTMGAGTEPAGTFNVTGPSGPSITGQGTNDVIITGTTTQINADLADADPLTVSALIGALFATVNVNIKLYLLSQLEVVKDEGGIISYRLPSLIPFARPKEFAGPSPQTLEEFQSQRLTVVEADAHFLTLDGLLYDFNALGEFVLAESTQAGDAFQVQIRLQGWNSSASATVITQVAAAVGNDRVTIDVTRPTPVWVDGIPVAMAPGTTITLPNGQLTQISTNSYLIDWNTGEVLQVVNNRTYLDVGFGLGPGDGPGTVVGLMGPNEGQANDFMLPDGTVLPQPLTTAQLYGTFADAWRVQQSASLFDYGPGQNTATFTLPNIPLALADLPASLLAQAANAISAAGITDPGAAGTAEFDYIATGGDTQFLTSAANIFQGLTTTPAAVTESSAPPPTVGVLADKRNIFASTTGSTSVTFDLYLTSAAGSDTTVNWAAIAPFADDFTAATFGGTLPSGQVTIPAGRRARSLRSTFPRAR